MRDFGPVVPPQALLVTRGQIKRRERRCIRSQLVRHDDSRGEALVLEKVAHQLQRRALVASALHDDVENFALVVDRAPEVHLLATDPDHHLVEMPT